MPDPAPTVFILDADESIRESIAELILSVGLRAETFASVLEFLKRKRHAGPCCVVLDVKLPDLGGLEWQARLASERAAMPLIFTTSGDDIATAVRAMKAGAFEFLQK